MNNRYCNYSRSRFVKALLDGDIPYNKDMREYAAYLIDRDDFVIKELRIKVQGARVIKQRCLEMMETLKKIDSGKVNRT